MKHAIKGWLKEEKSQVSSETGILTVLGVLLGGGIAALIAPKAKAGFDSVMSKFTSATNGSGTVADPTGSGQVDWSN